MIVRIALTSRLAEFAGFRERELRLAEGETLAGALRVLEQTFASGGPLVPHGRLHPSILVLIDGTAYSRDDGAAPLRGGETIELLLPVAGG
jgi:molybdopterin converting factor small subunit